MSKNMKNHIGAISGAIFLLVLFYWMTSKIGLYGDDWCYSTNSTANSLQAAIDYYFVWSGRFFSELWTYIAVRNKTIYEWLNPVLFVSIFWGILSLSKTATKNTAVLLLLMLMMTVHNYVRTQTYTWIAGSTYIISLCLLILLFNVYKKMQSQKQIKTEIIVAVLLNIYISLSLENAAVVLVIANVLLLGWYLFQNEKQLTKIQLILLVISVVGFIIMRSSPGSTYRLARDHQDWLNLSLFEQILSNLPNFITLTFIDNRALMLILTALLIIFSFQKIKKAHFKAAVIGYFSIFYLALGAFILAKQGIHPILSMLFDYRSSMLGMLLYLIYFIGYVVLTMVVLSLYLPSGEKEESLFYIILAGCANGAMLLSPTTGHRTAVYTIYFLFIICLMLYRHIAINKKVSLILSLAFVAVIGFKVNQFYYKYNLAEAIEKQRLIEVQYYLDNPESTDIWITAMPENIVHSANIYPEDTVHSTAFKLFYGLNPEANIYMFYNE